MKGLTNYISERPWSEIITEWYVRVDDPLTKPWLLGEGPHFGSVGQPQN